LVDERADYRDALAFAAGELARMMREALARPTRLSRRVARLQQIQGSDARSGGSSGPLSFPSHPMGEGRERRHQNIFEDAHAAGGSAPGKQTELAIAHRRQVELV